MKKRNLFLAVALIALMTGVLSAQTYDSESDFKVMKMPTEVAITEYVGTKTAVNIPPRIQNLPVTTIGGNSFEDNTRITSVTIPNGIIIIDNSAFRGCTKLISVTIPNGIKRIGHQAFRNCTSLTSVTFQGMIDQGDFFTSYPFPGDLRDKFFATGGGVGTYTRPNGTSETWTKAGAAATTATPASSGDPESDFQVTKTGNAITITKYVGTKTVINIPPSIQNTPVTVIGTNAFRDGKFTSVTIPSSVTDIGTGAFAGCRSLTSLTIGSGVKKIGQAAFMDCSGITSLTIPKSVSGIEMNAFSDCTNLTSVTFEGTLNKGGFHMQGFGLNHPLYEVFYKVGDVALGTPGTYTRPDRNSRTWTKK